MSIAFWCVAAAAFLPYLFVAYAKSTREYLSKGHYQSPRAHVDDMEGRRKRAYWAHLNGFEAFPPFAAAVILASLTQASPSYIDGLAVVFVLCRVAHGTCYILDWATMRSLAWGLGIGAVAGIFLCAGGIIG